MPKLVSISVDHRLADYIAVDVDGHVWHGKLERTPAESGDRDRIVWTRIRSEFP
jgi:hypothetical protein